MYDLAVQDSRLDADFQHFALRHFHEVVVPDDGIESFTGFERASHARHTGVSGCLISDVA